MITFNVIFKFRSLIVTTQKREHAKALLVFLLSKIKNVTFKKKCNLLLGDSIVSFLFNVPVGHWSWMSFPLCCHYFYLNSSVRKTHFFSKIQLSIKYHKPNWPQETFKIFSCYTDVIMGSYGLKSQTEFALQPRPHQKAAVSFLKMTWTKLWNLWLELLCSPTQTQQFSCCHQKDLQTVRTDVCVCSASWQLTAVQ